MASTQALAVVPHSQPSITTSTRSSRPHSAYKIRLTVLCAKNLSRGNYFNFLTLPDVFCRVECGSQSWTTETCCSTIAPVWRWNHDLLVCKGDSVLISLWNRKKTSKGQRGFLGCVRIKSSDILRLKDTGYQKLDLQKLNESDTEHVKGELIVSILSRDSSRGSSRPETTSSTYNSNSNSSCVNNSNDNNQRSTHSSRNHQNVTIETGHNTSTNPSSNNRSLIPTVSIDSATSTNPSDGETNCPRVINTEDQSVACVTPRRSHFERNARSSSARMGRSERRTSNQIQNSSSNPQLSRSSEQLNESPRERNESHSPRENSNRSRRGTRETARSGGVLSERNGHSALSRGLPKEYEIRQTSEGQVQYVHKESHSVSWYDPRVPRELIAAHLDLDTLVGPLPEGWEKRQTTSTTTSTPMTYFVNHNSKTTQLTDPRLVHHHERLYRFYLRTRCPNSGSPSVRVKLTVSSNQQQNVSASPPSSSNHTNPQPPPPSLPSKQLKPPMPLPEHDFNLNCKSYKDLVQKIQSLKQNLSALQPQTGHCRLEVSREDIFEESYRGLMKMKTKELRKKLMVKFRGEEGIDYGGVAREWLFLLSREMLNPSYGLFHYPREDVYTLQIHPHSSVNPDHLSYFHFVGRILGLAVFHGHHIQGSFSLPFYRMLLNKPVSLDDIKDDEPDLHRNLKWVLDNKIDSDGIDITFSVDLNNFGEMQVIDLIPGGREVGVTESNKHEYVSLYVNHKFKRGIEAQFQALLKGFHEVVPPELLLPFDEKELEVLITGCSKIDLKDWKAHTRLKHCTADSKIVKWFWEVVESFSEERKIRLLQFVTGCPRVPLQGFKALQGTTGATDPRLFTINLIDTSTDNLPQAHTCFNRIDLPPYETKEKLSEKLTQAVDETECFALE